MVFVDLLHGAPQAAGTDVVVAPVRLSSAHRRWPLSAWHDLSVDNCAGNTKIVRLDLDPADNLDPPFARAVSHQPRSSHRLRSTSRCL